jgi:Uma2 family endonuclease
MSAAKGLALMSVDEYLAAELVSDVPREYVGGRVYAMAGGTTVHSRVAVGFLGALHAQLRGEVCEPFSFGMKVRLCGGAHTSFYYPDGMVVCESNPPDALFQDKPVVIAEVVAKSTRRIDQEEKRAAYCAIPSLRAYLLIETGSPRVVVYRREEAKAEFVAEAYEGLAAVIPLPAIGAELRLAELYARVEFGADESDSDDEADEADATA